MIINKRIIRELEHNYRMLFPKELKQYLLMTYGEEPWPYEYSEQDLYTNIQKDLDAFQSDRLDTTIKNPSEAWQEERDYLRKLYIDKCSESRDQQEYINELEDLLLKYGLESNQMIARRLELGNGESSI